MLVSGMLLAACSPVPLPQISAVPTAAPSAVPTSFATVAPSPQPSATPQPSPVPTALVAVEPSPVPSATPEPSATPIPLTPTATFAPVGQQQRLDIFERVWTLVRDRYVYADYHGLDWDAARAEFEPRVAAAATPEAFYGLMYELIDRLGDEHSFFESPQDVAAEAAQFDGELVYVGIGAMIREVGDGGIITRVARDSPAEEAGLQIGDLILKIDGTPLTDRDAFGAAGFVGKVRGPTGTVVTLTVRAPDGTLRDVDVTRRPIPSDAFPAVEAQRLPNTDIGYLALNTFDQDNIDQLVRQQLEKLLQDGPIDGLIIDVRVNGGGRVDLMLNTIGLFADGGTIGSTQGRDRGYTLDVPSGETVPQLADVPIIVLTSEDTVSAAEMFAAGMQVLGRARIVGTHSAGNIENLSPHDLADGSRLWLAELAFSLPDGTLLEGRGVLPDRVVEADLWNYTLATDPQVRAAQAELRAMSAP